MRSSKAKAVVLVGHGSRARGFSAAMKKVAADLSAAPELGRVVCAYLEITPPSIPDAIARCVEEGAREVRVLPYFVLSGRHVKEDMPRIVAEARKKHGRRARIILCPYLGYDKRMVQLARKRISQAR